MTQEEALRETPKPKVGLTIGLFAIGAIVGFLIGIVFELSPLIELFSGRPTYLVEPGASAPIDISNPLVGYFRVGFGVIGAFMGAIGGQMIERRKRR